jgi:hypothetical protein
MSNYIHKLEDENNVLGVELCYLRSSLHNLRAYLLSDKFHLDTTVQVRDVLNRLDEAERVALDGRFEQKEMNERRRNGKRDGVLLKL